MRQHGRPGGGLTGVEADGLGVLLPGGGVLGTPGGLRGRVGTAYHSQLPQTDCSFQQLPRQDTSFICQRGQNIG